MLTALLLLTTTSQKLDKYQFVELVTGPKMIKMDAATAAKMQREHLGGLKVLLDKGLAIALGSVEDGGNIRGIVILKVATPEEAKALLADDPYVKSEQMALECFTWYTEGNPFGKRTAGFLDLEPCWLGLLYRGENPPKATDTELAKMQEAHLANIGKQYDMGKLFAAGPMGEKTPFRGIFMYRDIPLKTIKELIKPDPFLQTGRLELKLYKWFVAKGTVPPIQKT